MIFFPMGVLSWFKMDLALSLCSRGTLPHAKFQIKFTWECQEAYLKKKKNQSVNFTEGELAESYQLGIGTPNKTHFLVSFTFQRLGKLAGMSSCDDGSVTPHSHPSFPWGTWRQPLLFEHAAGKQTKKEPGIFPPQPFGWANERCNVTRSVICDQITLYDVNVAPSWLTVKSLTGIARVKHSLVLLL